jgi:hypothetical protein
MQRYKTFRLTLLLGVVALGVGRAEDGDPALRRERMDKWIETRRLISEEKVEWRTAREILAGRIELVEREANDLKEKTRQAEADIGEGDKKLAELRAKNETLKRATEGLSDRIVEIERKVLDLLARSPTPIRERVKPLSQRIPRKPEETELTLSERFQNVIGVLNEVNKFSREIAIASEVRELEGEGQSEVTVLYIGMSQAFFCNLGGGIAGYGYATADGWEWVVSNELAQAVSDVIAIHRNEQPAAYVPLPVEVR